MKITRVAFGLLALGSIAVVPLARAQSICDTRCDNQHDVCELAAESALEDCLDRAETPRQKVACAAEFTKLQDACRDKEAACLGNCAS